MGIGESVRISEWCLNESVNSHDFYPPPPPHCHKLVYTFCRAFPPLCSARHTLWTAPKRFLPHCTGRNFNQFATIVIEHQHKYMNHISSLHRTNHPCL